MPTEHGSPGHEHPYVLLTQPSLFDDSRAPAGKHTAWAYCHVPFGSDEDMTDRIEAQVERFAPGFRDLELPVEWVQPAAAAAHPLDDGTAVVTERALLATAEALGEDRDPYSRLLDRLVSEWSAYEPVVLGPFLPRPNRLLHAVDLRFMRAGLSSAVGLAKRFRTERARALLAGHAAHSMLPLEKRPSGGVGLILAATAHVFGWGFPRGGSQRLADALANRLEELGGEIRTESPVDELPRADVVLADVVPRELVRIAGDRCPPSYARALGRYRYGPGVFKLDWALDGPIPWTAPDCGRAATVHVGGTFEEIAGSERAPGHERPYVLLTQPSLFDDSRAPAGKHTAWAYCHVPSGSTEDMTERMEAQVERFAPGFRDLILARNAIGPEDFERRNRNIVGGDINGGLMDLRQLFFRPVRSLVPYRTPIRGVYICSSSTPPGGGVHGMCGYSAALVALRNS